MAIELDFNELDYSKTDEKVNDTFDKVISLSDDLLSLSSKSHMLDTNDVDPFFRHKNYKWRKDV